MSVCTISVSKNSHDPHARSCRIRRCCRRAERLGREIIALSVAYGAVPLDRDEILERMLEVAGLGHDAIAHVRFLVSGRIATIISPTFRTWRIPYLRRIVETVAERAFSAGKFVIVVNPANVVARPRLSNAKRIYYEKRSPLAGDGESVSCIIQASGGNATLTECISVLSGPARLTRVFGLISEGTIEIDLSIPLGPMSSVRLKQTYSRSSWYSLGWIENAEDFAVDK
jgi:hypothetical protein